MDKTVLEKYTKTYGTRSVEDRRSVLSKHCIRIFTHLVMNPR